MAPSSMCRLSLTHVHLRPSFYRYKHLFRWTLLFAFASEPTSQRTCFRALQKLSRPSAIADPTISLHAAMSHLSAEATRITSSSSTLHATPLAASPRSRAAMQSQVAPERCRGGISAGMARLPHCSAKNRRHGQSTHTQQRGGQPSRARPHPRRQPRTSTGALHDTSAIRQGENRQGAVHPDFAAHRQAAAESEAET